MHFRKNDMSNYKLTAHLKSPTNSTSKCRNLIRQNKQGQPRSRR